MVVVGSPAQAESRPRTGRIIAIVAVIAAAMGWMTKAAFDSHDRDAVWLTGPGYVGRHQFTVRIDGFSYGAEAPIEWVDRTGGLHDGSWPRCLVRVREQTITFAAATVEIDGGEYRPVLQVRCPARSTTGKP